MRERKSLQLNPVFVSGVGGTTLLVGIIALSARNTGLGLVAAVFAVYFLHLISLRVLVRAQEEQFDVLREMVRQVHLAALGGEMEETHGAPPGEAPRAEATPGAATTGSEASTGGGSAPHRDVDAGAVWREHDTVSSAGGDRSAEIPADSGSGVERQAPPGTDDAGSRVAGGVRSDPRAGEEASVGRVRSGDGSGDAGDGVGNAPVGGPDIDPEEIVIPRKFALGTVALIQKKLDPDAIARILVEQRQRPDNFFGELAVEMGFLTREELEELLEAQREGLFSDAEIRDARERLQAYRKRARPGAT